MTLLLAATVLGLSGLAGAEQRVVLAEKGEAAAVIVLPENAGIRSAEYEAAELLQELTEKISGIRLEILRERELPAVHVDRGWIVAGPPGAAIIGNENIPGEEIIVEEDVGNFILVGAGSLAGSLDVDASGLGPGGLRVKTSGNAVVLLGGPATVPGEAGSDDSGLRNAAIELLQQLGVHYLWPGKAGLVIPRRADLAVPALDITFTPSIRGRGIRWARLRDRAESGLESLGLTREDWETGWDKAMGETPSISWSAWQRLGGRMPNFGHSGGGLRDAERHLEENPEWFALQADGTRDQGGDARFRLCKSNPDLIAHVAADIIRQVREDPSIELVSLDPNDGGSNTGFCICDDCRALDPEEAPTIRLTTFGEPARPGSPMRRREVIDSPALTDRLVFYWRSIAEIVAEEHPHLLYGVSAYSVFSHPPTRERLHPNMIVRYVPSHTDFVPGWEQAGVRRMFWRPNILLAGRRDGKLRSFVGDLSRHMRFFADAGIVQTDFDSILHHWSTEGVNYYAAARLVWDPTLSPEEIIGDFARHGFGGGAASIQAYIKRVEALTAEGVTGAHQSAEDFRYTPEVVAELRALLDEAAEAAGDPEVAARVAFLRLGLNFTELQETLDHMAWQAGEGREIDRELARRLVDLNCLALRDIAHRHSLATHVAYLVWGSGTFARHSVIGGRTVTPSDPDLLDRVGDSRYGLTGRENSLEEMLAAFGL